MASYNRFRPSASPDKDASWGLIYRMNNLWARIDVPAENGDYDGWNIILDRIYCNLLYRNDLKVTIDEKTQEIKDIQISEEPERIYKFITAKIFKAKIAYLKEKDPLKKAQARSRWYHAVRLKDVFLRKYMMQLGLYLKETKQDPGTALFGNR